MRKAITLSVLLSFFSVLALPVQAAMVGTEEIVQNAQMIDERAKLNEFLQREDVKAQFENMGVASQDIEQRVAALTDQEVMQLNQQMETLPAGEGIVGLAVFLFVVFIITDALGATDLFDFVDPIR